MRGRVSENAREKKEHKRCKQLISTYDKLKMYKRISETIADELFFYTSFDVLYKLKMDHLFQKASQNHCLRNLGGKNWGQCLMKTHCLSGILPKVREKSLFLNQCYIDCAILEIHKLRNSQWEASVPESIELKERAETESIFSLVHIWTKINQGNAYSKSVFSWFVITQSR